MRQSEDPWPVLSFAGTLRCIDDTLAKAERIQTTPPSALMCSSSRDAQARGTNP